MATHSQWSAIADISLCTNLQCNNNVRDDFEPLPSLSMVEKYDVVMCKKCGETIAGDKWRENLKEQESLDLDIALQQLNIVETNTAKEKGRPHWYESRFSDEVDSQRSSVEYGQTHSNSILTWQNQTYTSLSDSKEVNVFSLDGINEIVSFAPCQNCGSPKEAIRGDREEPIAWFCKRCNDCSGLDDTFSIPEAIELATMMACALEKATLRVEPCQSQGCENDHPDLITVHQEGAQIVFRCDLCGAKYGEAIDEDEEVTVPDTSIQCNCGNNIQELFGVTTNDEDEIMRVVCLNCDYTLALTDFGPSNILGPSSGRTRVLDISILKRGDHIAWDRPYAVWHHAIVEDVDETKSSLDVIHYSGPDPDMKPKLKAGVFRQTVHVDCHKEILFRCNYDQCNSTDEVISRAISRLKEHSYNIFKNNCEHFARWCKTGIAESCQVQSLNDYLKSKTADLGTFIVKDGAKIARHFAKKAAENAEYLAKVAAPGTLEAAAAEASAVAGAAGTMAKSGLKNTMRQLGKFDYIGAGVVVGIEVVRTGYDIYKSYKEMNEGKIERGEFIRCRTKRVIQGLGGVSGTIAGGMVGSVWIPFPFIGSLIGSSLGALIGEGLGKLLGRWVA